jgi:DNA-binding response OmpR family regulator
MDHKRILLAMKPTRLHDDLTYQLQHHNFEVIHACDGRRVTMQIRRFPLDMVILEMYLPGFDGLELILNIKDMVKQLPIIAIADDLSLKPNILKAGGTALIHSSAEPNDIVHLVKKTIGV